MKIFEWEAKKDKVIKDLTELIISEQIGIVDACKRVGISYTNEYVRYIPKTKRDELSRLTGRKFRSAGVKPLEKFVGVLEAKQLPISSAKPSNSNQSYDTNTTDVPKIKPEIANLHWDRKKKVKKDLYNLLQYLEDPTLFNQHLLDTLNKLVEVGYITREQKGKFEQAFNNIETTFLTIP